jgi:hypothetical protein
MKAEHGFAKAKKMRAYPKNFVAEGMFRPKKHFTSFLLFFVNPVQDKTFRFYYLHI